MNINDIIIYFMLALMCLAVLDYAFGGRLGLGEKYVGAFSSMGALSMYMLGTLTCAPVLAKLLKPVVSPVFNFLGADAAMIAGLLIGSDSGAYPLALSLTENAQTANFSGLIVGSMLGISVTFLIPYLIAAAKRESRPLIAKGILCGIVTIPLGCFTGGFAAGYDFFFMLNNLTPVILFSAAASAGLVFFQKAAIKIFLLAGKIMSSFLAVALMAAAVQAMSGITLVKDMIPIKEAFAVVGSIIVFLVGAFVLVHILTKILAVPMKSLADKLNINGDSAAGLLSALANTIAMASLINDMDERGKILNSAFAVSAGFALGDHLAFAAGVDKDMILPVVAGKLTAGISALILACALTARRFGVKN
jgi:ethanolamine transporter